MEYYKDIDQTAINYLARKIRDSNAAQGFNPLENIDRHLLLIVSEIVEAQEVIRTGHGLTEIWHEGEEDREALPPWEITGKGKPCGFPVEIADAIIRLLDLMQAIGIQDTAEVILEKLRYNRTRPYKHGKEY